MAHFLDGRSVSIDQVQTDVRFPPAGGELLLDEDLHLRRAPSRFTVDAAVASGGCRSGFVALRLARGRGRGRAPGSRFRPAARPGAQHSRKMALLGPALLDDELLEEAVSPIVGALLPGGRI